MEESPRKRVKVSSFDKEYEMLDVLGKGRNSVVKFAKRRSDGKPAAVKVIRRAQMSKRKADAMIHIEISVLRKVKENLGGHPNVVSLFEVYDETDCVYIVLEFLEGGELFDQVVARGSYCEKDAAEIIQKIVSATKALHSVNVVHRDLKPENIVFKTKSSTSDIKLIDFGHSKVDYKPDELPTKSKTGLVGTPGYLAPEAISRQLYSPACDVWSIGVIMYILLCGYPPFYSASNERLLKKIVQGKFEFHAEHWDAISDDAKDLVRQMLTVDPKKRMTCEDILVHPWIAENHLTQQLPDSTIKRLGTFNARRKLRAAAMACVWGASIGRRFKLSGLVKEKQFSAPEMYQIQVAFKTHASGDGCVSKAQFQQVMESLGLDSLPLGRMYELFDKDGNNQVDSKEFLLGLGTLRDDNDSTLKFCFDLFDTDSSGHISKEELGAMFSHIASESTGNSFDRAEKVAQLFEKLDANGDNEISFQEFCDGIKRQPELKNAFIRPAKRRLSIRSISGRSSAAASPGSSITSSPADSRKTSPTLRSINASPRPTIHLSPEVVATDLFLDPVFESRHFRIEPHG